MKVLDVECRDFGETMANIIKKMSENLALVKKSSSEAFINSVLNSTAETRRIAAKKYGHEPELAEKLVYDSDSGVRYHLAANRRLPKQYLNHLIHDPEEDVRAKIAVHPDLSVEHISMLLNDPSEHVRAELVGLGPLKPHHIDSLLSHEDSEVRYYLAQRSDLNDKQKDTLVNDPDPNVREIARTRFQQRY